MKRVKAVQDDSCHWYVIPLEKSDRFYSLLDTFSLTEDYGMLNKFEDEFGKYRTGGDLNNIELYAKID